VDHLVCTIWRILNYCNYELSLWHSLGLNMYLQLLVELIHSLNKDFSHYETLVAINTLSYYHTIYLISKFIQINLMFIRLENCSIFIGPFINTL
jgi:hypothetical protein